MVTTFYKLILFLGLHLVFVLFLSLICWSFFDKPKKTFSSYIFLVGIGFSFFVFSYFLLPILTFYLKKKKHIPTVKTKIKIPIEELKVEDLVFKKTSFGEGGVSTVLKTENVPISLKEKALNIILSAKSPQLFGLIKVNLISSIDEVRLQTYSVLEKTEKFIMKNISMFKTLLSTTKNPQTLSYIYLKLANSYWDLILYNLVDESIKEEFFNTALTYLKKSISLNPTKEAYFLAGKMYLKLKDLSKAEEYLLHIYREPYYKNKVIPYLAELYFYKKEFSQIKATLSELKFTLDNRIHFVKELWSG